MNLKKFSQSAALSLALSPAAMAANLQNEITGATNTKLAITGVDGGSTTVFDVNVGYNYSLNEFWQVGGLLGYEHNAGANAFQIAGTGTYNFDAHFNEAIFAEGRMGLSHVPNSTNFHLGLYGGKRFELAPHVSFRPHVGFDVGFGDHSSFTFEFMPVAFSFWF